jgi:hypothetical protein
VTQRSIWAEDEEPTPRPRKADCAAADLLQDVAALLQFQHTEGSWHARLRNRMAFGHGRTPEEAIKNAKGV